jgi:hypothetical protein
MKSRRSTSQAALACALGALVCGIIAIVTGYHLGYGIVAGLITGYIAYEFRDVLRAVPIAYCVTRRNLVSVYGSSVASLQAWRAQPHPVLYPAALIVAPFHIRLMFLMSRSMLASMPSVPYRIAMTLLMAVTALLAFLIAAWFVAAPLSILMYIGARVGERSHWWPMLLPGGYEPEAAALDARGLRRQPLNYRNVARWTAKGVGLTVLFFVWTSWKYLFFFVGAVLSMLADFLWTVFKLIHSQARVLCALDGTIGGAIAYQFFIGPDRSIAQNAVAVAFGMVLGIGWGLVNYEIVSKRILKVVPMVASSGGAR